jgi:exoribonuclease-2
MPQTTPREGSLVLYKNRPARVKRAGKKLEIELQGAEILQVRPKDVALLHPGPLKQLDELRPQAGEVETAWEILAGATLHLAELAELVYGVYTPATAWAVWELVVDGLYFRGTPEAVVARSPEEVTQERAAREAKTAERQAWAAFLARVQDGQTAPEDRLYLRDVEALALGQHNKSRVLRHLGRAERPENAHALLLELGHWDRMIDPYPQRLGLTTTPPTAALPTLPQEGRVDLTHLPAFAIDDEDTQDPDDALSLEGERLWVHVADVATLVHPDGEVDLEARARGANLYLPEETVHMLPPQATQMLGLGLAEISPALSFGLDLTSEGEIAGVEVVPSWVRVTRLSYAEANARLAEEPFQNLYRLAQAYQARRRRDGAVSPEVKIQVKDGKVVIHPLPPLESRMLVTEAMLMAGAAAARFALERDIPFPFATQPPPLTGTQQSSEGLAGMYALRNTLQRSQTKSVPAPHTGLGLAVYARATSPLRRYMDLVAHQQLRGYLRGEGILGEQEMLERIGAAEAVAGSVRQAERLARQHWTLVYLLQHPGWRGEGILVGKRGTRGTVLIPELDLEPRVHLREDLPLNSVVPLILSGVELPELEAYFRLGRAPGSGR